MVLIHRKLLTKIKKIPILLAVYELHFCVYINMRLILLTDYCGGGGW